MQNGSSNAQHEQLYICVRLLDRNALQRAPQSSTRRYSQRRKIKYDQRGAFSVSYCNYFKSPFPIPHKWSSAHRPVAFRYTQWDEETVLNWIDLFFKALRETQPLRKNTNTATEAHALKERKNCRKLDAAVSIYHGVLRPRLKYIRCTDNEEYDAGKKIVSFWFSRSCWGCGKWYFQKHRLVILHRSIAGLGRNFVHLIVTLAFRVKFFMQYVPINSNTQQTWQA